MNTSQEEQTSSLQIKKLFLQKKAVILFFVGILVILGFVTLVYFLNTQTPEQTTQNNVVQESALSKLTKRIPLFSPDSDQEKSSPVGLFYQIDEGPAGSIATFYITTISQPVQGIQMNISYSGDIQPISVESQPQFPDLVTKKIDTNTNRIFAMATTGIGNPAIQKGIYPVFQVVYSGSNPTFTILSEHTAVANRGEEIPFSILERTQE